MCLDWSKSFLSAADRIISIRPKEISSSFQIPISRSTRIANVKQSSALSENDDITIKLKFFKPKLVVSYCVVYLNGLKSLFTMEKPRNSS